MSDLSPLQTASAALPTAPSPTPPVADTEQPSPLDQAGAAVGLSTTQRAAPNIDWNGTAARNQLLGIANSPDMLGKVNATSQALDLARKVFPNLSQQQLVDFLPQIYALTTGQPAPTDPNNLLNGLATVVQNQASEAAAAALRRMKDNFENALTAKPLTNYPSAPDMQKQWDQTLLSVLGPTTDRAMATAKTSTQASQAYSKQGWYEIANGLAGLGIGIAQAAPETAAGFVSGGPVGAGVGAYDSLSRMFSDTVYSDMRDKGIRYEIAAPTSDMIGYAGGAVVTLITAGSGLVAGRALKPFVDKALLSEAPTIARLLSYAQHGVEATTGGALGMTAQGVVNDLGENAAAQQENKLRDPSGAIKQYSNAIDQASKYLSPAIQAALTDYNNTALVPIKSTDEIVKSAMDNLKQNALTMGVASLLGIGGAAALRMIKGKTPEAVAQSAQNVAQDMAAEHTVQNAEPQPEATGEFVKGADGQDLVVHHATGPLTSATGQGLAFHEDPARAEEDSRALQEEPLEPGTFSQIIDQKYPELSPVVQAVMKDGPEAADQFKPQVDAFRAENPGIEPNDILLLADSIRSGEPVPDRNDLVTRYGLQDALPPGGIISAKLQVPEDKVAHLDFGGEGEIQKAFASGAQAVEHDRTWYVKDPKNVVVTGKTEAQAEAKAQPATPVTRESTRQTLLDAGLPEEHADAGLTIADRFAERAGMNTDEWLQKTFPGGIHGVNDLRTPEGHAANGVVRLNDVGQKMMELVKDRANVSTFAHELWHAGQHLLSKEDLDTLLSWTGEDHWSEKAHELAARGFETALGQGIKTGDEKVDGIFSKLAGWMKTVYNSLFDKARFQVGGKDVELEPEVKDIYDRIMGKVAESDETPELGSATEGREPDKLFQPSEIDEKKWEKQLQFHLDGTRPDHNIEMGRTPDALVATGMKPLPLEVAPRVIDKIMAPKDQIAHGHGFNQDDVKGLLKSVHDPVAVMESLTQPGTSVVLTRQQDGDGNPIVAAIHPDRKSGRNQINELMSAYGKDGFKSFWQKNVAGKLKYFDNEKGPEFLQSRGLQSPKEEELKASNPKLILKSDLVNDQPLFQEQDREKLLNDHETQIADKERALAEYEKAAPALIEKLTKGKSFDAKDEISRQVNDYIKAQKAANAADRANLETLRASPGPTRDQAEHEAVKSAVEAGRVVPDGYLIKYAGEDWADAEAKRRQDMRGQIEHAKQFNSTDEYLASLVEDRAMANSPDPFASDLSEEEFAKAEQKARDEATLTPEGHDYWSKVYEIAHAQTPEELDTKFKAGLTPDKVKSILAGMAQNGYTADKDLPRHVTSQVLKSREGGATNELEIPRIQRTMANDPRTYRRIEQQLHGDLAELAALALEDDVGKAMRDADEPPPEIKPIELPTAMNIEDKASIRLGTKSRAEWQRKALDAQEKVKELTKKASDLEARVEEVKTQRDAAKAKAKEEKEDLRSQAAVDRDEAYERTMANLETAIKETRAEMKAKEADRKAYQETRDQMRKMGEYLAKPVPKTVHVQEGRQIENMRTLVDPNFRTKTKAAALAARAEWFRAHPEAKMTDKLRREVFARNLNDWSYEDLHKAYQERKDLEDVGRGHLQQVKQERGMEYADRRRRILAAIYSESGKLHSKMNSETDEEKRQQFAQQILEREIRRAQKDAEPVTSEALDKLKNKGKSSILLTVSNLADMLDGGADWKGENHQLLHREVSDAVNHEAENIHNRELAMFQWIKDYNEGKPKEQQIQLQRLSDFHKFDGYDRPLMGDALLAIYAKAKNDRARAAMTAREGNNIREAMIHHVNTAPELQWMRDLGDHIIDEYSQHSDRLFDAMEQYDNISPPREEFYTPILKEHGASPDGTEPSFADDMAFDIGYANEYRRAAVNKSFSHARIDVPDRYQKPIRLGLYREWLSQVRKQEKYINMKPVSRLLEAVYGDREVEEAILHTYGGGVMDEIREYSKHVAGNSDRDMSAPAWVSNLLNRNANIAYLAYNVASTLKQLTTLPQVLPYASPQRIMGAIGAMIANPFTHIMEKTDAESVQMRTRMGALDTLANDRVNNWGKNKWNQTMGDVGTVGHVPLTVVDKIVAGIVHDAVKNTELDKGTLPSEAIARADWVVGRTQHSNRVMDATGLNRSKSGFARIFTALSGPAFKIANELTYGLGVNIKNGHYVRALSQLIGLAVGGVLLDSVSNWAIPSLAQLPGAAAAGVAKWIPFLGDTVGTQVVPALFGEKPGYMHTPTTMVGQIVNDVGEAGKGVQGLAEGKSEKAKQTGIDHLVKAGLDGFGLLTGFPSTIVTRIYKAARTGDPWELAGGKPGTPPKP